MLFKDLKGGSPLYVLDAKTITASVIEAQSVSKPYFSANFGMPTMVVDIIAQVDGKPRTYTFKQDTDMGFDNANYQVIATDRETIVRELESMKCKSEQALKQVEFHKAIKERCNEELEKFKTAPATEPEPVTAIEEKPQPKQGFGGIRMYGF